MSLILQNRINSSSLPINDEFNIFTVTNSFNTIDEFFSFYKDTFTSGPQFGTTYFFFINNQPLKNLNKDLINKRLIELISEYLDLSTIGLNINIKNDPFYIERDIYKIETPKKKIKTETPDAPIKRRHFLDFDFE